MALLDECSQGFWDRQAGLRAAVSEQHGSSGAGTPARGPGLNYLESEPNTVTPTPPIPPKVEWKICARRCESRFCPHCSMSKGLNLKKQLVPILERVFKGMMMLTFTVDPTLFDGDPHEAFKFVTKTRAIAKAMQFLRRRDVLHSENYFYVIEWQKNGMPHWHVLVDASFIPIQTVRDAWNASHPRSSENIAKGRPGFGSAKFSKRKFENCRHAANYATAYLIKHPEGGYPTWVMGTSCKSIRRFSTSHGFWSLASEPSDPKKGRNGPFYDPPPDRDHGNPPRTIQQVCDSCGDCLKEVVVTTKHNCETGEKIQTFMFVRMHTHPWSEVEQVYGVQKKRSLLFASAAAAREFVNGIGAGLRGGP
jgi:hypothetical protein